MVLSALARLATAGLLLKIRHRGPGLWWSAIVVALALGVTLPSRADGILMGGIAGPAFVSPPTWGLLLFAFLRCTYSSGPLRWDEAGALWLLIPTFVLWANIDESFLTGLLVLAAAVVGRLFDGTDAAVPVKSVRKSPKKQQAGAKAEEEIAPRPPRVRTGFSSWRCARLRAC